MTRARPIRWNRIIKYRTASGKNSPRNEECFTARRANSTRYVRKSRPFTRGTPQPCWIIHRRLMNVLKAEERSVFSPGEDAFPVERAAIYYRVPAFTSCIAAIFISPSSRVPALYVWRIPRVALVLFIRISIRQPYARNGDLSAVISATDFIFLSYYGVFGFYCFCAWSRRSCDTRKRRGNPRKSRASSRYWSDQVRIFWSESAELYAPLLHL